MTPLDLLNWLMLVPQVILSLGFWLFPFLIVPFAVYSVFKFMVWPGLCRFGNWLGRE